ncbi:Phage DNA primase [Salmonella enterica subsp. enterica]|nr:Phage DNA primase [Salmonella enterica subsp. enterica]
MKVAASVCGGTDYWHSWRATGNALEGIASRHNDALLPLDELREVDPREAGMIAYMLANGQGKGRAPHRRRGTQPQALDAAAVLHRGAVAGGTHRTRRGAYLRRDGRAHGTNPQRHRAAWRV